MKRPGASLVVAAAAFIAYGWLAAPGVQWMDSGELSAAAYLLGGAHPPGHPAHSLLGKLATLLPIGEIAFRLSILSAAAMAIAVAGVHALSRALVPGQPLVAAVAAALAAASPLALLDATRPEVYAPVTALVTWAAVLTLRFRRDGDGRNAIGAGALCAFAAALHPVIAATTALPLAVALARAGWARLVRLAAPTLALGALALATYGYLPMRAHAEDTPLLMWGDPSTPRDLWALVTGASYRGNFALDGAAGRAGELLLLLGEGTGLALLFAGLTGLVFGAVTRLPGAAALLGVVAAVILGAAGQSYVNPDMAGYTLPALFALAAGSTALVAAIVRALPDEVAAHPAATPIVLVPIVALALLGPVDRASAGDAAREDALRHWDATVGLVPPGPAIYVTISDHALFPALYERLVAGARPDVAIAHRDLVRDIWFLRHLDRWLPALYVPYVDDGAVDAIVERLVANNLREGRYVGGEVPAFGQLRASHAAPRGRGWRYALTPVDSDPRAAVPPPPPDYRGRVGARAAGAAGLERARYEAGRDRLDRAARAAGLDARFGREGMAALARAGNAKPALFGRLPAVTKAFIFAPWQRDTLADDLAWRAGLEVPAPAPTAPLERRLLAGWHALLDGEADARARILALGREPALATARLLFGLERGAEGEAMLRDLVAREPADDAALILLASAVGNRGDFDEAAVLFRRAAAAAPNNADAHARLGVAEARRGDLDAARQSWQRALVLDPSRTDVANWLRSVATDGKPDAPR